MDKNIIPEISVLMPVYNCQPYIEESVNSILNQTFTDFEFIIIDDCSTDGTFEYLQSLTDPRIKLIRKTENTGYTISLNMGLDIAQGKYIARMDGDDISVHTRFEKQVAFMNANPEVVVCGGAYEIIGSNHKIIHKSSNEDIVLELISFCHFGHPTVFMRNITLKSNNIKYDIDYEPAEDYKMWTILWEYGKLANLTDVLLYYRVHPNQTTSQRGQIQSEIAKNISIEYVLKLSSGNANAEIFSTSRIRTIEDFKKYESVELDIKNNLTTRGIWANDKFFLERKKKYLKQSFSEGQHSIPLAIIELKLLFKFRYLLGSNFILKYFIKSIIYWKTAKNLNHQVN